MSMNGTSPTLIKKLVGLKTDEMFDRYNIGDESRLADAAAQIDTLSAEPERKVVSMGG